MCFIRVSKIRTQDEYNSVVAASKQDGHGLIAPTHFATKDGEIVGAGSLGVVPSAFFWSHGTKSTSRDSWQMLTVAENVMAEAGIRKLLLPCQPSSPFYKYMEAFGYASIGDARLFVKEL